MRVRAMVVGLVVAGTWTAGAQAVPFSFLDASYTAKIVGNGQSGLAGIAFANGKVLRNDGSNTLYILDPGSPFNYHGDNLYGVTTKAMDASFGWGMVVGTDGYLYAQTGSGIRKFDMTTGTSTVLAGSAAGTFGMKQTSTGKLAYSGNDGYLHLYDLSTNTDMTSYYSGTFNDDLAVSSSNIFIAALGDCTIRVLDNNGTYINTIHSAGGHCADGTAFGNGAVFGNNTDGTITRYDFTGDFTTPYTESIIASGKSGYQDFAAAGPDGAFYVTRDCQVYTDNFTDCGRNLVRLELVTGGGFDPGTVTPEPATVTLMATGLIGLFGVVRRRRKETE